MFTGIFKIFIIAFFIWEWTNNSKAQIGNILNKKCYRLLAHYDTSIDESYYHTLMNDYKKPYVSSKNSNINENQSNEKAAQSENYNQNKSKYFTDFKKELIKILTSIKNPKMKQIFSENEKILEKDLLEIYELIKHVIPKDKYLQMINRSCELAKQKHLYNIEDAEAYYNSILHLLRTYFFLTRGKKDLGFKNNIFKAVYLNLSKFVNIIDKYFKTKLLKLMINQEINPKEKLSYKEGFILFSLAWFYPILLFVISIFVIPLWSVGLTFSLLGVYMFLAIHSNYKIVRDARFINQIKQRSVLLNREYFT
ncbi:uncharacterized protein LOC113221433 [Piliocolobus tephrosceles]|uniref:uncharacterized protein LOC113221433 n=1 Tax=Piliocolobus tephrosceles TaxID=591936 RepID=UPI000E6AEDAC|nr:uncharacterized protein LOC113221433 [Piliocolobus tephrosceles]